jgi:hypothetical protein
LLEIGDAPAHDGLIWGTLFEYLDIAPLFPTAPKALRFLHEFRKRLLHDLVPVVKFWVTLSVERGGAGDAEGARNVGRGEGSLDAVAGCVPW